VKVFLVQLQDDRKSSTVKVFSSYEKASNYLDSLPDSHIVENESMLREQFPNHIKVWNIVIHYDDDFEVDYYGVITEMECE
jgi:hypothetical protein